MTNVAISVYGPDGAIRRSLNIGLADVALNIAADEQVVQGEYDPDTHWVIDGHVHVVPPRPSRDHSWLPALRRSLAQPQAIRCAFCGTRLVRAGEVVRTARWQARHDGGSTISNL